MLNEVNISRGENEQTSSIIEKSVKVTGELVVVVCGRPL